MIIHTRLRHLWVDQEGGGHIVYYCSICWVVTFVFVMLQSWQYSIQNYGWTEIIQSLNWGNYCAGRPRVCRNLVYITLITVLYFSNFILHDDIADGNHPLGTSNLSKQFHKNSLFSILRFLRKAKDHPVCCNNFNFRFDNVSESIFSVEMTKYQ
jgi:hypothetical protein